MSNKLLVVVDMQHDFVDGVLGSEEAKAIVPKIEEYIGDWDGDIIFTMDTHKKNDYRDLTIEETYLPEHCKFKTKGWELVYDLDELKHMTCAKSINKRYKQDSFSAKFINYNDYNCIVFVGVCTDICVISSALDARSKNPYANIFVRSELCAGTTPENHEAALKVMKSCLIEIS